MTKYKDAVEYIKQQVSAMQGVNACFWINEYGNRSNKNFDIVLFDVGNTIEVEELSGGSYLFKKELIIYYISRLIERKPFEYLEKEDTFIKTVLGNLRSGNNNSQAVYYEGSDDSLSEQSNERIDQILTGINGDSKVTRHTFIIEFCYSRS